MSVADTQMSRRRESPTVTVLGALARIRLSGLASSVSTRPSAFLRILLSLVI
jgi:hypothetical protein